MKNITSHIFQKFWGQSRKRLSSREKKLRLPFGIRPFGISAPIGYDKLNIFDKKIISRYDRTFYSCDRGMLFWVWAE